MIGFSSAFRRGFIFSLVLALLIGLLWGLNRAASHSPAMPSGRGPPQDGFLPGEHEGTIAERPASFDVSDSRGEGVASDDAETASPNEPDPAPLDWSFNELTFSELDWRESTRLYYFAIEKVRQMGPDADRMALGLRQSTNQMMRMLGMAMLAQIPELDQNMINQGMSAATPADWLVLEGWLRDAGRVPYADYAAGGLDAVLAGNEEALLDLMASGDLDAAGMRAALHRFRIRKSESEAGSVARDVAEDAEQEASVRVQAMAMAVDALPAKESATWLRDLAAREEDAGFAALLGEYAETISAANESAEGSASNVPEGEPKSFGIGDLSAIWTMESGLRFDLLDAQIDQALDGAFGGVDSGVAAELRRRLVSAEAQPWDDDQTVALRRLSALCSALEKLTDPPAP